MVRLRSSFLSSASALGLCASLASVLACSSTPANQAPPGGDDAAVPGDDAAGTMDGGQMPPVIEAGPPCSSTMPCQGGATCCNGTCTNPAHDPANCGKCGNACTAAQFCTGQACMTTGFANLCANPSATVALDPYTPDNTAGAAIGAALTASCSPPTKVSQSEQDGLDVTDPASGRPMTGPGDTFIAGGGSYGQKGVAYMQSAGLTTLSLDGDGTNLWFSNRTTSAKLAQTALTDLTAHHDFFSVEVAVEPTSGTLFLAAIGMMAPGTAAAAYWSSTTLVPKRATFTDAWYIYEWLDSNNDSMPDAADAFTLVAEGQ